MSLVWERITDGGTRRPRTVYWRRGVDPATKCRLTVAARPELTWRWAVYLVEPGRPQITVAEGAARSVAKGRRLAERAEAEYVLQRRTYHVARTPDGLYVTRTDVAAPPTTTSNPQLAYTFPSADAADRFARQAAEHGILCRAAEVTL